MRRSVAVMLNARLASSRCANKMVRPFAGSSLVEIALRKLAYVEAADARYFCVGDPPLLELFDRIQPPGVELLRRSPGAVIGDAPQSVINAHYLEASTTHIAFMNACHPFLEPSTLDRAIDRIKTDASTDALTSTVARRDWMYAEDGRPLVDVDLREGDTKRSPLLHRVAHAFHLFPRDRFAAGWPIFRDVPGDPVLFAIDEREAIDVDTELEFAIAHAYASAHGEVTARPWFAS